MKKVFCCSDLNIECDWEGRAETEEELLKRVAEHAAEQHSMKEITQPMREIILSKIRDSD